MKWLLLVLVSGSFEAPSIQVLEFDSQRACFTAEAKIEDEWNVQAICTPVW